MRKRGKTKILQNVALLGMLFRKKGLNPGSQTRTCTKVYYHTDISSIVMNLLAIWVGICLSVQMSRLLKI